MRYSEPKLRELILYLARAEHDDYTFGRVKLAKLLYYVDMEAYVRRGEPVTGATYIKRKEGPAAREFVPIRDQMLAWGEAAEVDVKYPNGFVGKKLVARRDPDESLFDAEELKVADEIVARFSGWSGTALSILSHKEIGWTVASMNDPIPYNAYYLAPSATAAQRRVAEKVVGDLNLAGVF